MIGTDPCYGLFEREKKTVQAKNIKFCVGGPSCVGGGKNHLHQSRDVKLSDTYYFVQRLRNCDPRFSNDTSYLFAAACYLEKRALQNNINISYQRGKKTQGPDGRLSYKLDDGFNVFDNIPNTPKYWKNAKEVKAALS